MSLLSIFIKEEPVEVPVQKAIPPPSQVKITLFDDSPSIGISTSNESSAVIKDNTVSDNKYPAQLDALLSEGNFFNFLEALKDLVDLPITEQQKYITAFKALKRNKGTVVQDIIADAEEFINILQNEKNEFESALGQKKQIEITDKEAKIVADQKLIQEATERIQIAQQEINAAKNKLQTKEIHFINAFDNKVQQVTDISSKINTYLNAITTG